MKIVNWLVKVQDWIEQKFVKIGNGYRNSEFNRRVSEEVAEIGRVSDYRISRLEYELDLARIDLVNMNRWRERALAAESKVERTRAILRQRGPRPLRLP